MENKKINSHIFLILLILSFISLNKCLLEIPLKPLKVKGIVKYRNIKIKEPKEYTEEHIINETLLISEGKAILNEDLLFLINIKIGSNNQEFNLVLDTGFDNLWVAKLGSKDKYKLKNHYDPTKSSTKYYTGEYYEGSNRENNYKGYFYTDNIKYINNKNFKLKFAVADETDFNIDGADGVIGLNYKYTNVMNSFIHMLKEYQVTDSLSFSLKFEKDINIGMSGKLYIGKHKDFSSSSSINTTLSLTNMGLWFCIGNSIGIQNSINTLDSKGLFDLMFDTGFNGIILPLLYFKKIENKTKDFGCNVYYNENNSKQCQLSCPYDKRVDIRIGINDDILIIPKDIIYYKGKDNLYNSKVVFTDEYFYLIGTPFFLVYHTLFDRENQKMHFYPLNNNYRGINDDEDGGSNFSIIGIVIVIIFVIIILCCIIYRIISWKKSKRELEQSSSIYNTNFL